MNPLLSMTSLTLSKDTLDYLGYVKYCFRLKTKKAETNESTLLSALELFSSCLIDPKTSPEILFQKYLETRSTTTVGKVPEDLFERPS